MKFEKGEVARVVLATLMGGVIVVAAASVPGIAQALYPFLRKKHPWAQRRSLENALRILQKRREVELATRNGEEILLITERGRQRIRKFELERMQLGTPTKWDRHWSVILFDIPETKKTARDALRRKLNHLGCLQFHKSVFVHPARCEDEVDFITELFQIGQYVTVFRTPSLGRQEHRALRHFALAP